MCGMCESHMNDVVRKSCSPKKVNSSAKNGETVVISEAPLDIPYLKQQIKDIGYELVSYTSEPYEKKGFLRFGQREGVRDLLIEIVREKKGKR